MASYSAQQTGAIAPVPADAAPQLFRRRDEGFTLVEVIWALMLIGLIAMGSLALFLNGMKTVAHMQRQQAAVSLASSAMDVARSVAGGAVNAAGTSGLIKGRSQSAVQTVWDQATAAEATDTADMTVAWDPQNGLTTADQWVPVRTTATIASQPYTIDTLIGKCYRVRAASLVSQNCVATNPSPSTDTYVEIYRVRVVVRWDEGEAAKGAHTYRVSSLVDPSADATWNTSVKPFAYDDEFSVSVGASPTFHAIVLNDSVDYDTSGTYSPIFGLTQPPAGRGSVAVVPALGINGVRFTPPGGSAGPTGTSRSGTVTFQYKVRGELSGDVSADFATVTVHIVPTPVQDSFPVESGVTHDITDDLRRNDFGLTNYSSSRKTTIVPVWDRSVDMFSVEEVTPAIEVAREADRQHLEDAGITVDSDGRVHFDAPDTNGAVTTFYYYLVDDADPYSASALRYPSAEAVEVRITTQEAVMTVAPMTRNVNATAVDSFSEIPWRTLTTPNNAADNRIRIESITGPGATENQVRLDGDRGLGTGSALAFETLANTVGTYELTYRVVSPGGKVSPTTGVLTINVLPVTTNVSVSLVRSNSIIRQVDLATIPGAIVPTTTTPPTPVTITNLSAVSPSSGGSSCAAMSVTASGTILNVSVPTSLPNNRVCTFTYRLSTIGTPTLVSTTTTRTVTVTVRSS